VGALVIGIVVLVVAGIFWGFRNGIVLGAVTVSSWVLDFITHRGDLAIIPGDTAGPHVGLGLWSVPWAAILLELAIGLVGAYLYYHASMRMAVRLERQQSKTSPAATPAAPTPAPTAAPYRRNALTATLVLLVLLLATLAANILVA
jgi:hypothetical protein